jgi:3-phosphoshikimate 1-carboxyvinyltransferase
LLAAVACGTSQLRGVLRSDDAYWCLQVLKQLGVKTQIAEDAVTVVGCGRLDHAGRPQLAASSTPLFVGSAGTLGRFLPGLLMVSEGGPWEVDATAQLRGRPLQPLVQALQQLGGDVQQMNASAGFPLRIAGLSGPATPTVHLRGDISSQFISGVLMAAPLLPQGITVACSGAVVQPAYVAMTLASMQTFGVSVTSLTGEHSYQVVPQPYRAAACELEADASTAGYFFGLAALLGGSMTVENMGQNTQQPDIGLLAVLQRMGCTVQPCDQGTRVCGPKTLHGGFTLDLQSMSDQTPTVAALATMADAPIGLRGVAHIRHHECDRIAALCQNLTRLGGHVQEHDDGLTVHPTPLQAARLPTYGDHRIAMAMAMLGARVPGVVIEDPSCVSKTCPQYFTLLQRAGVPITYD